MWLRFRSEGLGRLGFSVTGCELDKHRCEVARREARGQRILRGNCFDVLEPDEQYDAIVIALPWDWFKSPESAREIDVKLPDFFYGLLRPGGMLVLDSTYRVTRSGQILAVSTVQAAFFSSHGFALTDVLEFLYAGDTYEADTSLVLGFTK